MREFEEREAEMLLGRLLVGDVDRGGKDAAPIAVHVDRLEPDSVPPLATAGGIVEVDQFALAGISDPSLRGRPVSARRR